MNSKVVYYADVDYFCLTLYSDGLGRHVHFFLSLREVDNLIHDLTVVRKGVLSPKIKEFLEDVLKE